MYNKEMIREILYMHSCGMSRKDIAATLGVSEPDVVMILGGRNDRKGTVMSTMLRLDPPLPLVTPKGEGMAHVLIDFGAEHHLQWVVFIDATGECWTFDNPDVRLQDNLTKGRAPQQHRWRPHWRKDEDVCIGSEPDVSDVGAGDGPPAERQGGRGE